MGESRHKQELLKEVFESYALHTQSLETFLKEYEDGNASKESQGQKKYLQALQRITDGDSQTLVVEFDDLKKYFGNEKAQSSKTVSILDGVLYNTKRYIDIIYAAAEKVRKENTASAYGNAGLGAAYAKMEHAQVPLNLRAPFDVRLRPPEKQTPLAVRDVKAQHVGSLVSIDAIVAKVTPVKPRLQVAAYQCSDCGSDVYQAIDGGDYMPLMECNSKACIRQKARGDLQLLIRESKFVKHQEVKIQEPSQGVPPGSIPRTMKVVVEGDLARRLSPGTAAVLSGVLLPVAKSGYAALRAGLIVEKYFEVHSIEVHKKGYSDLVTLAHNATVSLEASMNSPKLYQKLAHSIAPSICGHEDVKKLLLLQLVGGVTESFADGMKIRGDIHILLMGDPGVAKSQLLRQICKIAPRAHYTTGKGSSGVGLTASVTKDPVTGEFALEGGAIVLSDNGICCIDEFDKMNESDRTAIHEVMEQQTVSIAKAGLATTLNARTSILAAANPVYGRYDIRKSPVANMNLPAALLSRFDVHYLLLDQPDLDNDLKLAKHVLEIHRGLVDSNKNSDSNDFFDAQTMRYIICHARQSSPRIHPELIGEIAEHYVELRSRERSERNRNEFRGYTTPRTLLAILRLSQALARLRRAEMIDRSDVDEAMRLMQTSKNSVITDEELGKECRANQPSDFRSEIMSILRDVDSRSSKRSGWTGYMMYRTELLEAILMQGLNETQLRTTIDEYVELEVLVWKNDEKRSIAFADRLEMVKEGGH